MRMREGVASVIGIAVLMICTSGLEGGAEDLLPVVDGLVLGGCGERCVDGVAGIERGIDDRVSLRAV